MIRNLRRLRYNSLLLFVLSSILFPVNGIADVSLLGSQQLGDNSLSVVSHDQLQSYPFYFLLDKEISLSAISLSAVASLEPDSAIVVFIDGVEVGTGNPGSSSVPVDISLASGLHTLAVRGSCYDSGTWIPCSGAAGYSSVSIPDLSADFVDPVTDLIAGDLNTAYQGTNQSDGIEITINSNRGIDLGSGNDRLYIHGDSNGNDAIILGDGDDVIRIGSDKNAPLELGNNDNQCQIDGNANNGTILGGDQIDIVKIKVAVMLWK